jgi:hypothetical protein
VSHFAENEVQEIAEFIEEETCDLTGLDVVRVPRPERNSTYARGADAAFGMEMSWYISDLPRMPDWMARLWQPTMEWLEEGKAAWWKAAKLEYPELAAWEDDGFGDYDFSTQEASDVAWSFVCDEYPHVGDEAATLLVGAMLDRDDRRGGFVVTAHLTASSSFQSPFPQERRGFLTVTASREKFVAFRDGNTSLDLEHEEELVGEMLREILVELQEPN